MLFYLSMSSIHKFLDCDQCKYCKNDFLLLLLLSECEYVKVLFFILPFGSFPLILNDWKLLIEFTPNDSASCACVYDGSWSSNASNSSSWNLFTWPGRSLSSMSNSPLLRRANQRWHIHKSIFTWGLASVSNWCVSVAFFFEWKKKIKKLPATAAWMARR